MPEVVTIIFHFSNLELFFASYQEQKVGVNASNSGPTLQSKMQFLRCISLGKAGKDKNEYKQLPALYSLGSWPDKCNGKDQR